MPKKGKKKSGTKRDRSRTPRRRGRSRSPKRLALEGRVLNRTIQGESTREAAKHEGVSKSAVHRILSRDEFRALQGEARSDVVQKLHKAVEGLDYHLGKKGLTAILETLKGTQILVPRAQTELALSQPAEYTEWGYADYAKRTNEELEFAVKFHHWPSEEEIAVKKDTGYWPQELLDKKDQQ